MNSLYYSLRQSANGTSTLSSKKGSLLFLTWTFIISTKRVRLSQYILSELRRAIKVTELAGLTKALNEKSTEFVIHVKNDYDYRMET